MTKYIVYKVVKKEINSRTEKNKKMQVSDDFIIELDKIVSSMIDEAVIRACAENRPRLMPKHLPIYFPVVKKDIPEIEPKTEEKPAQTV